MMLGFTRVRFVPKLPQYEIMNNLFDYLASKYVNNADILYGWIGKTLKQIRKAKNLGIKTVIHCGTAHPSFQRRIVYEEYKKWKVPINLNNRKLYLRALKEIQEADYIHVSSDFVIDTFVKYGIPKEKLIKVPLGVDLNKFKPKNNYENDKFRAIFVGNVGIHKVFHI